jgi:transposase
LTDAHGTPLVAKVTAANVNDSVQLIPMVDAIPPVGGKVGAPRRRPKAVQAARGYRSRLNRRLLWVRRITPIIPETPPGRAEIHGSGLGVKRWPVERTISWLHAQRRLRVRFDRRADIHQGFLTLACVLICHRRLRNSFG